MPTIRYKEVRLLQVERDRALRLHTGTEGAWRLQAGIEEAQLLKDVRGVARRLETGTEGARIYRLRRRDLGGSRCRMKQVSGLRLQRRERNINKNCIFYTFILTTRQTRVELRAGSIFFSRKQEVSYLEEYEIIPL